jgi:hypothetical protein
MRLFLIIWLVSQACTALIVWLFTVRLGRPVALGSTPRVAVIVAVKGHDFALDEFLSRLFAQDYPAYRVIFAVETATDPAVAAIETWRVRRPETVSVVVAGLSTDEAQKVANLRAALTHLTPADEIVAFVDADIWTDPDWLKRLIAPLVAGEAEIVSGFPWLVIKDGRFASYLVASLGNSISTLLRVPHLNAAWGGSTSIRRDKLEALNLRERWRGTLVDDLQLTWVAQAAGYRIVVPREMLPRQAIRGRGLDGFIAAVRRWNLMFRVYTPITYVFGTFGLTFASAGWLLATGGAVLGNSEAAAVLAAAFALNVLRTLGRLRLVVKLWGKAAIPENLPMLLSNPFIAPLSHLAGALCAWSALFMRRTTWAGTTYEVSGRHSVRVVSRRD